MLHKAFDEHAKALNGSSDLYKSQRETPVIVNDEGHLSVGRCWRRSGFSAATPVGPRRIRHEYEPGSVTWINNPGQYIRGPFSIYGDLLVFDSIRASGNYNILIQNGTFKIIGVLDLPNLPVTYNIL